MPLEQCQRNITGGKRKTCSPDNDHEKRNYTESLKV